MSVAKPPTTRPEKPPIMKRKIKDRAYNMGGFRSIEPLYMVPTQLKTFTALGMATIKVKSEKDQIATRLIPEVNM